MKISEILRKVGLYKPAKLCFDFSKNQMIKVKAALYKHRLNKYNSLNFSCCVPKVLVIMNAGGIGNVVEATPLVQAIRVHWPKSIITILSLQGDLFEDWCVPDKTVYSFEQLRSKVFDHTFCPYWCWSDYDKLIEVCDPGRIHKVKLAFKTIFLKPEREYNLDLIRKIGFKGMMPLYVSVKKPQITIPKSDLRVCFVPGAKNEDRWKYKRWPYYHQLADLLVKTKSDVQIFIIGTESDRVSDRLLSNPNVMDLRGKLTLAETAWVLKNSDIAVGNDCGPMHIADAVQIRSLVIFGPTCPIKNGPVYKGAVIYDRITCRPCQFIGDIESCGSPECIDNITPEIVLDKLLDLIEV